MTKILDFIKTHKKKIIAGIIVIAIIYSVTAVVEGNVSAPFFNE